MAMCCHATVLESVCRWSTSQVFFINFNEKLGNIYHLLMLVIHYWLWDENYYSCGRAERLAIFLLFRPFKCFLITHLVLRFVSYRFHTMRTKANTGPRTTFVVWEMLAVVWRHLAARLASRACLCSEYQITVIHAKLPSALCQCMLLLQSHLTSHSIHIFHFV